MATKIVHFVSHYCGPQECDCSPRCHAREGDEIVTSSSVAAATCKNCLRGLRKDRHPDLPQSKTIAEERDQLKAENEALRNGLRLARHWCASALKAARVDSQPSELLDIACLLRHQASDIDAAMGKGEQS